MRIGRALRKISQVPVGGAALAPRPYHPRYVAPPPRALSPRLDRVTEENRFLSLELMLAALSGHAGRRQYRMARDLPALLPRLRALGTDWHDLKALAPAELRALLGPGALGLPAAERALLLEALGSRACGVVTRGAGGRGRGVCMAAGRREHGWRCGRGGHTADVYFEGKQRANAAVLAAARRSGELARAAADGVAVSVRPQPDFSVAGREFAPHPRVWRAPADPSFVVEVIGYDFRVHPDDPRAAAQVEAAAAAWETHAAVVQHVAWELLELRAVAQAPQPLDMAPGELGPPDAPQAHSSAFTTTTAAGAGGAETEVVEHRMRAPDGSERPWFTPPPPQDYEGGVPRALPYAPSIIVRGTFRAARRLPSAEAVSRHLLQPLVDVSCYTHPRACFWLSAADERRWAEQVLDYARRLPHPLPFTLYLRVDPARALRESPALAEEKERRMRAKAHYFDLRRFRQIHAPRGGIN